jgi:hypothetical protein
MTLKKSNNKDMRRERIRPSINKEFKNQDVSMVSFRKYVTLLKQNEKLFSQRNKYF